MSKKVAIYRWARLEGNTLVLSVAPQYYFIDIILNTHSDIIHSNLMNDRPQVNDYRSHISFDIQLYHCNNHWDKPKFGEDFDGHFTDMWCMHKFRRTCTQKRCHTSDPYIKGNNSTGTISTDGANPSTSHSHSHAGTDRY